MWNAAPCTIINFSQPSKEYFPAVIAAAFPSFDDNQIESIINNLVVNKIADIKIIETDTNIEALILEANLINKHKPPYNVLLKDDKTFGGIFISDNKFPLVYPARITDQLPKGEWFGPYVSARELKIALKVLRHIFRWCDKPPQEAKLLINN